MAWYDRAWVLLVGILLPVGLAFYLGSWVVIPVWYFIFWVMHVANL